MFGGVGVLGFVYRTGSDMTAQVLGSWNVFLPLVDLDSDVVLNARVEKALVGKGWKTPASIVQAVPEDVLDGQTLENPEKAFVRRCILHANTLDARRRESAAG